MHPRPKKAGLGKPLKIKSLREQHRRFVDQNILVSDWFTILRNKIIPLPSSMICCYR